MAITSIRLFKKNSASRSITQINQGIDKINAELARLNEYNDTVKATEINTIAGISHKKNIMERKLSFLQKQKVRIEEKSL